MAEKKDGAKGSVVIRLPAVAGGGKQVKPGAK